MGARRRVGCAALGCSFAESLKRREELLPIIAQWSPDHLLHHGTPPIYFQNEWGLTKPEEIAEMNYKVHSPAWAVGFRRLAEAADVECYTKYLGHPSDEYDDMWDFAIAKLKEQKDGG